MSERRPGECAVCHYLGDEGRSCEKCHWPIGEAIFEGKPYGFDVAIELRADGFRTEFGSFKRMGSAANARSYARQKKRFIRILAMRPLTREQWVHAYGEGRM